MATFDVVIPTFDNVDKLRACLFALERQEEDLRALVCVDGSTDGTLDFLAQAQLRFPIEVMTHPGNGHRGRAATRNLALGRLSTELVLLLDSDMELEPGALAAHRELLERETCASVGAVDYRNRSSNPWAGYISARRLNRYPDGARLPPQQLMTANTALRSADLLTLGGFDERLAGYGGEDTEFGYRLAAVLGRSIIANHAARASATEEKTIRQALAQLEEYGRTNLRLIRALHPEFIDPFGTQRLRSQRPLDRLFRAVMNPFTDAIVKGFMPLAPFRIKEEFVNYQVVRAVCRGYLAGERNARG